VLKLRKIRKDYVMKDSETVHALKGISINFRRNEFVAILGPSGCGKTTLLNIVGGLDRYSSGNLFIEWKSTKKYDDRDWDTYRNHSIGFIFQSYNLIGHQNVLSNVELALTISGISKKERRERALEALEKVGLKGSEKKKPNQMSGGQMQRVAIARALINNPEILLADEPTGALDSETSIQIMELLKEVAKDKLVIMVTHNPDLAYKYANRIVTMKDGLITGDSNPYKGNGESKEELLKVNEERKDIIAKKGKKEKTSMSFITAFGLSLSNLLAKFKRTLLIAIAGSIGIIGVSSVLAVSFGITNYVKGMQDDMLSSYPIQLAEESIDYTSLITGLSSSPDPALAKFDINSQVGVNSMINYLMEKYTDATSFKTNDINENLVKYVNETPNEYYSAMKFNYGIDVTNNLYCTTRKNESSSSEVISMNGLTQRYISELKTIEGFSRYASFVDLFTNFMKQMPDNNDYILNQYDLLGNSKMATKDDEVVLVLDNNSTLTDLVLAQMGYYDHDDFINIGKKAVEVNEAKKQYDSGLITKEEYEKRKAEAESKYPHKKVFNYDELLNSDFYYFPSSLMYQYGEVSHDETYEASLLLIKDDVIYYLSFIQYLGMDILTGYRINVSSTSDPETVYFVRTGTSPKEQDKFLNGTWAGFDIGTQTANGTAISIMDIGSEKKGFYIPDITQPTQYQMFNKCIANIKPTGIVEGYNYSAVAPTSWVSDPSSVNGNKVKVVGILRPKANIKFGSLSRGVYYTKALTEKYINDCNKSDNSMIFDANKGFNHFFNSGQAEDQTFKAYVTYNYYDYSSGSESSTTKAGYAYCLNGELSDSLSSLFPGGSQTVDLSSRNATYYRAACGYKPVRIEDEHSISYEFKKLPQQMSIYPKDFANKDNVTRYLDKWNSNDSITLKDGTIIKRSDRTDITYTDTVKLIITVINTLIQIVTIALICFTSLSLIVSCFMIAVITYISTMERVKEIGIIRSLGGRKKDVSRLFIAETLIIGLASGVFGVLITYLLSAIINVAVSPFGITGIASLPIWVALIMIIVSILLNVLSGLIPSMKASKQDPVIALRSE